MAAPRPRSEADIVRERYRFVTAPAPAAAAADGAPAPQLPPAAAYEERVAARYSAALYREYALADLSQYRVGRVGFRWRTRVEVLAGKGESSCGSLHCDAVSALHTYEVPFTYEEEGSRKATLVKVRLCGACGARLLHYVDAKKAAAAGAAGGAPSASAAAATCAAAAVPQPPSSRSRSRSRERRRRRSRSRSRSRERRRGGDKSKRGGT
jgi:protein FRA10AC1